MPPKKKKGGGKKKKEKLPQKTRGEVILEYKIGLIEKQIEDVNYEIRGLDEKNERNKQKLARLKEERDEHCKIMLEGAKQWEKELSEQTNVSREEVIAAMKDKYTSEDREKQDIRDLKDKLTYIQNEIDHFQQDVNYWREYQGKGQHDHSLQIKLLKQEIIDMDDTFCDMENFLHFSHQKSTNEIISYEQYEIEKQKHIATEKAMAKLDKDSRLEVIDNDWLCNEVNIHQIDAEKAAIDVERLEEENIKIMEELFECHRDDLKISQKFFLSQIGDNDNVDETILQTDLAELQLNDALRGTAQIMQMRKESMQKLVTEKLKKIVQLDNSDDDDKIDYDGYNKDGTESEQEDPFADYFHYDDEDFQDYLQLGPIELKLLQVIGNQIPIYEPKTPSDDQIHALKYHPEDWPITGNMIKNVVTEVQNIKT